VEPVTSEEITNRLESIELSLGLLWREVADLKARLGNVR
jgi:hypothetical protein